MGDARNTKKMYKANLHYEIAKRRTKARWKDDVANDITKRETLLSRPVNALDICIKNIIYNLSTPTYFNASASSSGILTL
jgi:hypothetical protein